MSGCDVFRRTQKLWPCEMACRWLQQLNPLLPPLWHAPVLSAFENKNNEFSVSCFSSFLQQIFIENLPVSGTILRLKGWNRK